MPERRKRGRPPITETPIGVTVYLPPDLHDRLSRRAEEEQRNLSAMVRYIVAEYLRSK